MCEDDYKERDSRGYIKEIRWVEGYVWEMSKMEIE